MPSHGAASSPVQAKVVTTTSSDATNAATTTATAAHGTTRSLHAPPTTSHAGGTSASAATTHTATTAPTTTTTKTTTVAHDHSVTPFGDGFRITLRSPDLRVELLTLGASINAVQVRNPHVAHGAANEWLDVCLGYDDADECAEASAARGATCGRVAGRIAGGEFALDGVTYKLLQNWHAHTLHGGPGGFHRQQWKYLLSDGEDELGVSFHLTSPHLDQGFPGELYVTATYTIQKQPHATLQCVFRASLAERTPAAATVVNMTNHAYWNLNGVPRQGRVCDDAGASQHNNNNNSSSSNSDKATNTAPSHALPLPVTNHHLRLASRYFAATNAELIPSGEMVATEGTVHDYTKLRCIDAGMRATAEQERDPAGYDDPVALDTWDGTLREAALLYSPQTRLQMRVCTTNPAIVVYTANHLPVDADGSRGRRFQQHSGICLECQYFPNSPNVASFPSTVLRKGETYSETTTHEFKFLTATP